MYLTPLFAYTLLCVGQIWRQFCFLFPIIAACTQHSLIHRASDLSLPLHISQIALSMNMSKLDNFAFDLDVCEEDSGDLLSPSV